MRRYLVTDADTATALGSGDVAVLATPRLLAWMEAATLETAAAHLDGHQTTVGCLVHVEHRRPTPVGGSVEVIATLPPGQEGRRLRFVVEAFDRWGEAVAVGEIERAIVERSSFIAAVPVPDDEAWDEA